MAVADAVTGHPEPTTAFIGLLQVHPEHRGRGAGRALHEEVLRRVRSVPEITTVRLSVVTTNAEVADPFWRAMGYTPTGEVSPWMRADGVDTTARF